MNLALFIACAAFIQVLLPEAIQCQNPCVHLDLDLICMALHRDNTKIKLLSTVMKDDIFALKKNKTTSIFMKHCFQMYLLNVACCIMGERICVSLFEVLDL